jgi:glycosyltransferase involved in cell wall biosynthesis
MMCGKPIVVSDGGSMAKIVRRFNCGIVVPYGDVDAVRNSLSKLKNDPRLRRQLSENGRKAYEEQYSWDEMKKRLVRF